MLMLCDCILFIFELRFLEPFCTV